MLAMVACGVFPTVEDACRKLVRVAETVKPDPELSARYEAGTSSTGPSTPP